jgi:hypothetical protein
MTGHFLRVLITVMKRKKEIRNKWLHLRLNETEYQAMENLWKQSTCRELSDYARKTLLQKPVVLSFRNASADAILSELVRLKNELNGLGNKLHQLVHAAGIMSPPAQKKEWSMQAEKLQQCFLDKADEIKTQLKHLADQWLLK